MTKDMFDGQPGSAATLFCHREYCNSGVAVFAAPLGISNGVRWIRYRWHLRKMSPGVMLADLSVIKPSTVV